MLVLLLLLCYGYVLPRWADWNQNSRFDLTVAIVEHGTLTIDCCVANTGDYARFDGHTYTDKAPGLSLLAVPVHTVFVAVAQTGPLGVALQGMAQQGSIEETLSPGGAELGRETVHFAAGLVLATLVVVVVPSALFGAVFYRFLIAAGAGAPAALATTLAYGLATIASVYAGAFYAHQLVAALCFTAFVLVAGAGAAVSTRQLVLVGLLLGLAVVSEYPAALSAAAVVGLAAARVRPLRRLALIVAGAAAPLAVLVAYDVAVFGTPLPVGYRYSELFQKEHSVGLISLSVPTMQAFWGITVSSYRGLFLLSPILLMAFPGFVIVLRRPELRAEGLASAAVVVGFLLFNTSSVMWDGGSAIGPRYLVPMLPFLAWPVAFALAPGRASRAAWGLAGVLGVASLLAVWALRLAGQQFPADRFRRPLIDYAWPYLREGEVARNAGMLLGLHGWWSILPLLLLCGVLAAVWRRAARAQAPQADA
jgi:hypothetical protein